METTRGSRQQIERRGEDPGMGSQGVPNHFTRANLANRDLCHARLPGAWLAGADLTTARLQHADLANANLTDANLAYADLRDTDLTQANLAGANLRGADLRGARLVGVRLRGSWYDEATQWPAGFDPSGEPELRHAGTAAPRPQTQRPRIFWGVGVGVLLEDPSEAGPGVAFASRAEERPSRWLQG